jgi:hypothetical protein
LIEVKTKKKIKGQKMENDEGKSWMNNWGWHSITILFLKSILLWYLALKTYYLLGWLYDSLVDNLNLCFSLVIHVV